MFPTGITYMWRTYGIAENNTRTEINLDLEQAIYFVFPMEA